MPRRVNYLPSGRNEAALIGKRSATWRRLLNGATTHQVNSALPALARYQCMPRGLAQDGRDCLNGCQPNDPWLPSVQVTGYEVRRIVADPAALPLAVTDADVADDGHATLHTPAGHHFASGKNLVRLQGLEAELDGAYAVVAATTAPPTFRIKLPAAAAAAAEQLKLRAQQGGVTARCVVTGTAGLCEQLD